MEPVAGGMLAALLLAGTAYANHLTNVHGATANDWAIGVNVFSWIAQFVGHGKFEGRAPALLDNLVQALFLAPFFVWFEILFALGYRPELKERMTRGVQDNLRKLQETRENNKANDKLNGHASANGTKKEL